MFRRLKKRFYLVLMVIAVLLTVILASAYMVIDRALVSDYSVKTEDIARKIIDDLKVKTDYAEYISLLFIDNLLAKADSRGEVTDYDFNADVSNIKIYNSDIDGLGIFWDDGGSSLSSTVYLQYVSKLNEIIKRENKTSWVIVKEINGEKGYLFLITPVHNNKNLKSGFALIDATSLKKSIEKDNLFLKDAVIYFKTSEEILNIIGDEKRADRDGMIIEQPIQDNLKLVMNFPMTEVKNELIKVKLYMIFFGILFVGFALITIYRMVNKIVSELEFLKREIDEYASEK